MECNGAIAFVILTAAGALAVVHEVAVKVRMLATGAVDIDADLGTFPLNPAVRPRGFFFELADTHVSLHPIEGNPAVLNFEVLGQHF